MTKQAVVYILANKKNGTLYVGVTSHLERRMQQHKEGTIKGFTKKYECKKLVFYQFFPSMLDAITSEKKLKRRARNYKVQLIEESNFEWKDLSEEFL